MSDIDLSDATKAARKKCRDNTAADFIGDMRMEAWAGLMAHYAVTAAAPVIEAQVRERAWREGFAAGFTASGEGWNGEISSDRGTLDWDIDEAARESRRGVTS